MLEVSFKARIDIFMGVMKLCSNKGNFIELLKWLALNNEEVEKFILKNALGNYTLTSPDIQKEIVPRRLEIIKEIDEDHYTILANESSDASHKEKLALCSHYVDKLGRPSNRGFLELFMYMILLFHHSRKQ